MCDIHVYNDAMAKLGPTVRLYCVGTTLVLHSNSWIKTNVGTWWGFHRNVCYHGELPNSFSMEIRTWRVEKYVFYNGTPACKIFLCVPD